MFTNKFKKSLIFIFASLFILTLALFSVNLNIVKADSKLDITMYKGASVRLQEDSGLRFKATLTNYNPEDNLEYGMVIVPKDYLTTYNITDNYVTDFDSLVEKGTISTYINAKVKPVESDGEWIVQHSIINIRDYNYARDFVGIAYAFNGTSYQYAISNDNERSITFVASAVLNDLYYNENLDESDRTLYNTNKTLLTDFVEQGIANVTANFNPSIDGRISLSAGTGCVLQINSTENIKLDWRYSSSNTNVAAVSSVGEVSAYSVGKVDITAKCAGLYEETVIIDVSGQQFDFSAYWRTTPGIDVWEKDGVDLGDDYALEKLQEYKDAGLNVFNPGRSTVWEYNASAGSFNISNLKRLMDLCSKVGLKVLVFDEYIRSMCNPSDENTSLHYMLDDKWRDAFFTNGVYDEQKVVDYIQANTPYTSHPAFYGFDLYDEPYKEQLDRISKVYAALREVYPTTYIHVCLHPRTSYPPEWDQVTTGKYYEDFLTTGGLEYLFFDDYPMYNDTNGIDGTYIYRLKWRAEICKAKGIDLKAATQTYGANESRYRQLDEADLYWLNNMLLGFGVKDIYYYTYLDELDEKNSQKEDANTFIDYGTGEKNATYSSMKKIMAEMQLLAPMALQFDYNAAQVHTGTKGRGDKAPYTGTIENQSKIENDTFVGNKISSVSVDYEGTLVTELTKGDDEFMYMVQNIADPDNVNATTNGKQSVTLTFQNDVKEFILFEGGKYKKVVLDGNAYTLNLDAGQAAYIFMVNIENVVENTGSIDDLLTNGETYPLAN